MAFPSPKTRHLAGPDKWRESARRYWLRRTRAETERIGSALQRSVDPKIREKGARVRECSCNFEVMIRKDLTASMRPYSCDVNVCPTCAAHRYRTTLKHAAHRFGLTPDGDDRLRMFTVTFPRIDPLTHTCREAAELVAGFWGKLTRSVAWKRNIHGALARFEATFFWDTGALEIPGVNGWNWHVHCVAAGRFWPSHCRDASQTDRKWSDRDTLDPATCPCREERRTIYTARGERNIKDPSRRCLASLWYDITGGEAKIVDAREAYGSDPKREAIKYVVKTVTLDDPALRDYVGSMTRFQSSRWYGAWQGAKDPNANDEAFDHAQVSPVMLWEVATGLRPTAQVPCSSVHFVAAVSALELEEPPDFKVYEVPLSRGPPKYELVIDKAMATRLVDQLEKRWQALDHVTDAYWEARPDKFWDFYDFETPIHVPF